MGASLRLLLLLLREEGLRLRHRVEFLEVRLPLVEVMLLHLLRVELVRLHLRLEVSIDIDVNVDSLLLALVFTFLLSLIGAARLALIRLVLLELRLLLALVTFFVCCVWFLERLLHLVCVLRDLQFFTVLLDNLLVDFVAKLA